METPFRITRPTLDVLEAFLVSPDELHGFTVGRAAGKPTGSVYPILARMEQAGASLLSSAASSFSRRAQARASGPRLLPAAGVGFMNELTVATVLGLLAAELSDISPWLARRLARWAARRINDATDVERYEGESLTVVEDHPGKLIKVITEMTFPVPAWRLRRELRAIPRRPVVTLGSGTDMGPRPQMGCGA